MALPLHLRKKIADHDPNIDGRSISQFCRDEGIQRQSYYNIKKRVSQRGNAGIRPDSTAPKTSPHRYSDEIRQAIVDTRRRLKANGLDYGPWSIYYALCDDPTFPDPSPSRATIAKVLAEAGLSVTNPRKRPRSSFRRFARGQANELWQIDGVFFRLHDRDATHVTIYQIIDDATRFDVGTCAFIGAERSHDACNALSQAFQRYGKPQQILSDNGDAFAGYHKGFVSRTETWLAQQGILMIAGFRPTTQGKDERSHQTLRKFLDCREPATMQQLDQAIDDFRQVYNTKRRHQALLVGKMHITPHEAWMSWPRAESPTTPIDPADLWERAVRYRSPQLELPAVSEHTAYPPRPLTEQQALDELRQKWGLDEEIFVSQLGVVRIGHQGIYIGSRFKNRRLIPHIIFHYCGNNQDFGKKLPATTTHIIELYTAFDGELLCVIPMPITYINTNRGHHPININEIHGAWHRHPPQVYKKSLQKRQRREQPS